MLRRKFWTLSLPVYENINQRELWLSITAKRIIGELSKQS